MQVSKLPNSMARHSVDIARNLSCLYVSNRHIHVRGGDCSHQLFASIACKNNPIRVFNIKHIGQRLKADTKRFCVRDMIAPLDRHPDFVIDAKTVIFDFSIGISVSREKVHVCYNEGSFYVITHLRKPQYRTYIPPFAARSC